MIKKLVDFIEKNFTTRDAVFLSITTAVFAILRFPSVFEPHWYGDEGIYEVIGVALRQGRGLYSEIWDNKPPILYLIYALFDGDLFSVRLASLLVGMVAVVVFFLITKKLFKNYLSIIVSNIFFVFLLATPVIEGNIANAENFMILPTLLAFYLLFCLDSKRKLIPTIAAGILLSFSFLTKIVAIFDFISFALILIGLKFFETISFTRKKISGEFRKLISGFEQEIILAVSFAVPITLTFLYFSLKGVFSDFWQASFSQNVGYVGYGNYFLFPMGFLILKVFLLVITIVLVFIFRKRLGKTGFIVFIWTAISLFDTFFSNRPYTHYLLVLLPSIALFVGFIFENKKLLLITVPLLIVIFLIVDSNFNFYKRLGPYYGNFVAYLGGKDVDKYQNFFDSNTSRGYHIADFVKSQLNPEENIFLWGDSAQIYVLSGKLPPGRYTVMYHITSYPNAIAETQAAVEKSNPRFIIQTKDNPAIAQFLDNYELRYKVDDAVIYEKQF